MRLQREDGVAAVEFAIVLPILLLIMFGIIEFGFVLFEKQVITNASREGARAGIVQAAPKHTEDEIKGVVKGYLTKAGLEDTSATIDVTGEGLAYPNDLTVRVDYPYTFLVLSRLTGGSPSLTLRATTIMKHE
jgi:Flp pilus assembly protein TadG